MRPSTLLVSLVLKDIIFLFACSSMLILDSCESISAFDVFFNSHTPSKTHKMAKAARKSAAKKGAKKSNRKPKRSYKVYIGRVLKQTAKAKLTLSGRAMAIVNSFVKDMLDRIATQATQVARVNKKSTMGSREIQTAVRLVLPTELAKHANSEAAKSLAKASA